MESRSTDEEMSPKRIAVVSGGSRGIGAELVGSLCAQGYLTFFIYLSRAECAHEVMKRFPGSVGVQADVRDFTQIESFTKKIIADFGHIDVLVNCAGIVMDRTLHKMSEEEWTNVINTNLFGVFNLARCVLPHMRKRRSGRIVSIASVIGQAGNVGQANYAASKAGLVGFTKSIALENASFGITANAISPGFIETSMLNSIPSATLDNIKARIPMQRFGHTKEIAATVAFLCSPEAAYITGQEIGVNGGLYM